HGRKEACDEILRIPGDDNDREHAISYPTVSRERKSRPCLATLPESRVLFRRMLAKFVTAA
ncbi:MAG: hypothetical protein ABSE25_13785, partial [Syntrophorhabdales bacterium]